MLKSLIAGRLGVTGKLSLANIFLVTNVFVWYYGIIAVLQKITIVSTPDYSATLLVWSTHFLGIILSALAGASLTNKIGGRKRSFICWILLGAISTLFLLLIGSSGTLGVLLLSFLLGISLGFGMPNCIGYYSSSIPIENRGRLGGLTMLASGIGIVVVGIMPIYGIILQSLILTIWRLSSLIVVFFIKPQNESKENKIASYRGIFSQRSFILYFIPWLMFSLLAYLSTPIKSSFLNGFNAFGWPMGDFLAIIGNGLMAIFAVIGGFLLDYIGRKRVTIIGFVILGLGYSILGIFPDSIISWYFQTITDGIAWGFFFVIFILTIWGDLSDNTASDKYYSIGVLPFFMAKFLQLTIGNFIIEIVPNYSSIFSFIAFFLFLAVLPLVYAPETLPEKHIKDRELKSYLEKAQKVREKYS